MKRVLLTLFLIACSSKYGAEPAVVTNDSPDAGIADAGSEASPALPDPLTLSKVADLAAFPVALTAQGENVAVFDANRGRLFIQSGEVADWYESLTNIAGPALARHDKAYFLTGDTARACPIDMPCTASDDLHVPSGSLHLAVGDDTLAYGTNAAVGVCDLHGCLGASGVRYYEVSMTGANALALPRTSCSSRRRTVSSRCHARLPRT